ncbi:hypothetical protein Tco_0051339 [Tanacetum coccineum]
MIKKGSKCENKGIVPTEMELVLEYTQQGASHEVSLPPPITISKRTFESRAKDHQLNLVRHISIYLSFNTTVGNNVIFKSLRINLVIICQNIPSDTKDHLKDEMEMEIPSSRSVGNCCNIKQWHFYYRSKEVSCLTQDHSQSIVITSKLTNLSPNSCILPDILFLVSWQPAWSASAKAVRAMEESFEYHKTILMVPRRQGEQSKRGLGKVSERKYNCSFLLSLLKSIVRAVQRENKSAAPTQSSFHRELPQPLAQSLIIPTQQDLYHQFPQNICRYRQHNGIWKNWNLKWQMAKLSLRNNIFEKKDIFARSVLCRQLKDKARSSAFKNTPASLLCEDLIPELIIETDSSPILAGRPNPAGWSTKTSTLLLICCASSGSDSAGGKSCVCKKQTIVATSSTEAEYVAAASCCAQAIEGPRFEYLVVPYRDGESFFRELRGAALEVVYASQYIYLCCAELVLELVLILADVDGLCPLVTFFSGW